MHINELLTGHAFGADVKEIKVPVCPLRVEVAPVWPLRQLTVNQFD